jgi:hypothetical protein
MQDRGGKLMAQTRSSRETMFSLAAGYHHESPRGDQGRRRARIAPPLLMQLKKRCSRAADLHKTALPEAAARRARASCPPGFQLRVTRLLCKRQPARGRPSTRREAIQKSNSTRVWQSLQRLHPNRLSPIRLQRLNGPLRPQTLCALDPPAVTPPDTPAPPPARPILRHNRTPSDFRRRQILQRHYLQIRQDPLSEYSSQKFHRAGKCGVRAGP